MREPDAAVAQNVVAAGGAAGQVAGVAAGHHAEPGPGGRAGEGAGWPLTPTGLEVDQAILRGPVSGRGRAAVPVGAAPLRPRR